MNTGLMDRVVGDEVNFMIDEVKGAACDYSG